MEIFGIYFKTLILEKLIFQNCITYSYPCRSMVSMGCSNSINKAWCEAIWHAHLKIWKRRHVIPACTNYSITYAMMLHRALKEKKQTENLTIQIFWVAIVYYHTFNEFIRCEKFHRPEIFSKSKLCRNKNVAMYRNNTILKQTHNSNTTNIFRIYLLHTQTQSTEDITKYNRMTTLFEVMHTPLFFFFTVYSAIVSYLALVLLRTILMIQY